MRTRPLVWLCVALCAGAFAGIDLPREVALAAGLAGAAAGVVLLVARGRPAFETGGAALSAALLLLAAGLGLARGGAAPRPAWDPALAAWLADEAAAIGGREPLLLEAEVRSAEPASGGARLVLAIARHEPRPGQDLEVAPDGLAAEVLGPRSLHRGDVVRGLARLRLPEPPRNPGARDLRPALRRRGLAATGALDDEGLVLLARGPPPYRWLDELRARFSERCADVCRTPQRAAVVAALGVGDRSAIAPELDEELAASGLVHLLSSAGLHLAAAAWLARWLALRLAQRLPGAGRRRDHAWAGLLGLPAALGEVLLLGVPWPALRAGVSTGLLLSAPALGRRTDGLTALWASAAACALGDPASLHDLSLQLSLVGVFGLIAVAPRLRELVPVPAPAPETSWRARPGRLAGEAVLRLFCASLAAALCTAPLLAAAFHRVSLVSAAANALALWPGLVALPAAALAVPLDALARPAALPLLWLADGLAGVVLEASARFAALPGATLRPGSPGVLDTVLWAALVGLLAGLPGPVGGAPTAPRPRPRLRWLRAALPASLLLMVSGARAALRGDHLEVTFLSVGQGDSALIRFPDGTAALVDAGGDLRGLPAPHGAGRRDPGARDVLPALAELGVSRLALVVLTHPHPDHAGGLPAVLRALPVDQLWLTGEPGPGEIGEVVRRLAGDRGVPVRVAAPGDRFEAGGAWAEVLAPDPHWSPDRSTNDNSLVLRLVHREVALLLAGDAEALEEAQLAQGTRPVRAQLLKAGHHGSRTSTTDAFLRAVAPEAVVFSAGAQNTFGFPHPEVVARAEAFGARVFSTTGAAVLAESDGRTLVVRGWVPP